MTPDIFFRHPYMIDDIPHSEGLPHTWDDEGELILHLLEECNSADRVKCIGKVQGDQYPVWMVT